MMSNWNLGNFKREHVLELEQAFPTGGEAVNNEYIHSANITFL